MKTAVSLPVDLFRDADKLAKKLKVSRSELYRRALKKMLEEERDAAVKEQLNRVYAKQSSRMDPAFRSVVAKALSGEDW